MLNIFKKFTKNWELGERKDEMFVEHDVFIGLRDVAVNNKVTNTALLSYLEDAGGVHSNLVGYGLKDIPHVKKSWVLLDWKIEIFERPEYADKITIKTWSRGIDKLYAYRDFELLNSQKKVIGVATSRWVLLDIDKEKITRIGPEVEQAYTIEGIAVFEEQDFEKLKEPDNFLNSTFYTVNRSLIDVNHHLHNIYFMDIANEILPIEIYEGAELNHIRMMYKKEIKLGDTVKVFYGRENGEHVITIKSENEKYLHAIIRLS